ncbi:MAG: porin family protein [Gammaproteobacteria bacterium]|nr:porin family protein [Gammaproteobacteria bacterium]
MNIFKESSFSTFFHANLQLAIMAKGSFAALLLLFTGVSAAYAVTPGVSYIGINYANTVYTDDDVTKYKPTTLIGRYGTNPSKYFSFEGRLGTGLTDDTQQISFTDSTLAFDALFGLYGILHINIMQSSSLYGAFGITQLQATLSVPGYETGKVSESGFSYGLGTDIHIYKGFQLNLEYMQYLDESALDLYTLSAGVKYIF